jgi:hypothetical protein
VKQQFSADKGIRNKNVDGSTIVDLIRQFAEKLGVGVFAASSSPNVGAPTIEQFDLGSRFITDQKYPPE